MSCANSEVWLIGGFRSSSSRSSSRSSSSSSKRSKLFLFSSSSRSHRGGCQRLRFRHLRSVRSWMDKSAPAAAFHDEAMSASSDTPGMTSGPFFKPEFHSWILIPDTAAFRKESSEDTANGPDGSPATAASEEAPDTCVTAESVILGTTMDSICYSCATSPVASCDTLSSSELLTPSWPLGLPRPCADALGGLGRDERIARVICYGGDAADSTTDGSSHESDCDCSVPLSSLGSFGRPLAILVALIASHFGVLVLGMYLGGRQQNAELTCLLRRFSSGPSGWQGRICAA